MITMNYQKRKNIDLFTRFEDPSLLFLSNAQNYIPIYKRFFNLNDSNYNSINLNNKWYISNINKASQENPNVFLGRIKNIENNKIKDKEVFFKTAPLLDPYKYMIGKYDVSDNNLFNLPKLNSSAKDCNPKIIDLNNAGYIDGMFLFLSSRLRHLYNFIHGVDFYGSFLGIKNNFKINVFDDIDYLVQSEFFNKNKNVLFKIEEYEHLFDEENKPPLKIGKDITLKSLPSISNDYFEDIFDDKNTVTLDDLKDLSIDLVEIANFNTTNETNETNKTNKTNVKLNTDSTCSSRTSHTNENDLDDVDDSEKHDDVIGEEDSDENCYDSHDDEDSVNFEEESVNVIIPKFPVQIIGMENCENTFDDLILKNDLSDDEWFSAFMQIIMILITYQNAFSFTHNDLHTNNVMYNKTDKKYLYYCYKKKYYKVPTFGRIFKIIDFGRSIFKFDGKIFCSDSFQNGGDAATQYNTEPYFNDKKPRLEPNYSFDLCRLACSIFDYVIDDFDEMTDVNKIKNPVKRLIFEWCLDDKGINLLYKNNGVERYPDFKLYKMIARCVHNHVPQAQLERPDFKKFEFNGTIQNSDEIINMDLIPGHY